MVNVLSFPKPIHHYMPAEIRSKFWLFTFNNYGDYPGWAESLMAIPNLTYLVYGKEIAPVTGTPHLQGYLELKIRTRDSTLRGYKDKGLHCHWEAPRHYDNWEECRAYCIKEGREVFEWGTGEYDKVLSRKRQGHASGGKRTDIDDIRDALTSGAITNTRELEMFPGLTYTGMLYADRFLRNARPVRTDTPDVYYVHGDTGLGKSRYAHEFIDRVERGRGWTSWQSYDNKLKWFDGYDKQEIALFDDFRGADCHFPTLLRITDRYVCRVEVKGASAWWCPKVIIITSSQSLEAGFGHLGSCDRSEQFFRRVRNEGNGGEFDFNDKHAILRFRQRISSYETVPALPPVPPALPEDTDGPAQVETGAEESKSDEDMHNLAVPALWEAGGGMPLSPEFGSLDMFVSGFNP